jgi:type II secretory pathway predicted ATPase ExeA
MKSKRQPFRPQVDPFFFFPGGGRREMISAIRRDLENGVCLIIVTGDEGAGKTMSCRMAVNKLPAHLISYYDSGPVASFTMMVQRAARLVLPDVSEEQPPEAVGELLAVLAAELDRRQVHMVIVLDNAEQIHLATLERIRKMLDQYNGERLRFQLLLGGTTRLEKSLEQLTIVPFQPVAEKRYHLEKLNYHQVSDYLSHVLAKAGAEGGTGFSAAEINTIYRGGDGNFAATNRIALELLEGKQPTISSIDASKDGVRGVPRVTGVRPWLRNWIGRYIWQWPRSFARVRRLLVYGMALALLAGSIALFFSIRPSDELPDEKNNTPLAALNDPPITAGNGQRSSPSTTLDNPPRSDEPQVVDHYGAGGKEPLYSAENTSNEPREKAIESDQGADQNPPQPTPLDLITEVDLPTETPPTPLAAQPAPTSPHDQPAPGASSQEDGGGTGEAQQDENSSTSIARLVESPDTPRSDDRYTDIASSPENGSLPLDLDEKPSDAMAVSEPPLVAEQPQDQEHAASPLAELPAESPPIEQMSQLAEQGNEDGEKRQVDGVTGTPAEQLLAQTKTVVQPKEVIIIADETPKRMITETSSAAGTGGSEPESGQDIDNLYQRRVAAAGEWSNGNGQPYTIFLTEFDSVDAVKQYLAADEYGQIAEQFYIVEHNGNAPLVSVYYGRFGDEQAALAAQGELPESITSENPKVMTTAEAAVQAGLLP